MRLRVVVRQRRWRRRWRRRVDESPLLAANGHSSGERLLPLTD
jgi:hypothetical protein